MGITTRTRERLARVLQERALGLGLPIARVRRIYPAREVRRTAILEALADLEAMGKVAWRGDRVRWVGALAVDRVLGEPSRRIERDRALSPAARASLTAALSDALVRRK